MKGPLGKAILVLIFGGILFLSNLGGWDLWNPDEPRYAQVAREMLLRHDFLVPHLNSEIYYDKPPLFFALIALSYKAFGGVSALSARFPSALFGILTLVLVFSLGRRLEDSKTGFLSSLVLATSFLYFWLARRANIDSTLTFFTTLSISAFFLGGTKEGRRWPYYLLGYVSAAFGFFTKLQPALIVPFLAIVPYFLARRGKSFLLDRAHLPGICAFCALVGGWLHLTYTSQGLLYLQGLLWEKTASTFFHSSGHDRPLYYYLYNFPLDFMPWGFFFPSAFLYCLKEKEDRTLFPLLWFSLVFLFFSLSKAKRDLYLLPLYPAASLMVGTFLKNAPPAQKAFSLPLKALAFLLLFAGVLGPFGGMLLRGILPSSLWICLFFSFVAIPLGFILLRASKVEAKETAVGAIVIGTALLYLFACWKVFPTLNPYKSYRPLCEEIVKVMEQGDVLAVYKLQGAEINFYTGIVPVLRIYDPKEIKEVLHSRPVLCVMRSRDLEALREEGVKVRVILRKKVGGKEIVVITNKGGMS